MYHALIIIEVVRCKHQFSPGGAEMMPISVAEGDGIVEFVFTELLRVPAFGEGHEVALCDNRRLICCAMISVYDVIAAASSLMSPRTSNSKMLLTFKSCQTTMDLA